MNCIECTCQAEMHNEVKGTIFAEDGGHYLGIHLVCSKCVRVCKIYYETN